MCSMCEWLLASVGLSFIITFSALFKPLRDKVGGWHPLIAKFLNCVMCNGFWCGLLVYWQREHEIMIIGLASSVLTYTLWLLLKPLMDKYD